MGWRRSRLAGAVVGTLIVYGGAGPAGAQQTSRKPPATIDVTAVSPESVGFSQDRLERLHAGMQQVIDSKQLPGMVTILARHGKVVDYQVYGRKEFEGAPMTKDAIFRAYSITKPVTAVAMMRLWEEGKWLPSDPISKFIPELRT
jgi:CubicO group peptidase (beta-lactamase class C family)